MSMDKLQDFANDLNQEGRTESEQKLAQKYREVMARSPHPNPNKFIDNRNMNLTRFGVPFADDPQYPHFKKMNVEDIFGLPMQMDSFPGQQKRVLQSSLVVRLTPAIPQYKGLQDGGLNLFTLDVAGGKQKLEQILTNAGITTRYHKGVGGAINDDLLFSVLNDTSITDSFTNEFADSAFESSVTGMSSDMGQEIKGVTGVKDIAGAKKFITDAFGSDSKIGDMMNQGLDTGKGVFDKLNNASGGKLNGLGNLITGSKVDFPMIWKSSSYNPSYSFTCRFYNPEPELDDCYTKYILAPLAHLLAFMTPISDSAQTFSFPLMCKFECPGLCALPAAYISQMDIIKGSEINDISFWQRPGIVDVRFTVSSLYSTMISKQEGGAGEERPTLSSFIGAMRGWAEPPKDATVVDTLGADPSVKRKHAGVSAGSLDPNYELYKSGDTIRVSNTGKFSEFIGADEGRLSIAERTAATDPALSIGTETTADNANALRNISRYKTERDKYIADHNGAIDIGTDLALRLKNNIKLPPDLSNYFWNNYDRLKPDTQALVANVTSPSDLDVNTQSVSALTKSSSKL